MSWMRHAGRHVHATVLNYVKEQMAELDWSTTGQVPFGAAKVVWIDQPVIVGDKLNDKISAGVISCTLGDELPAQMNELGGPLSEQEYPIFFDVFQDSAGAALAAATDVRDILMGRFDGTVRSLPLINQVNNAEVAGWRLEFEDVERSAPATKFPLHWQVVKVTAVAHFPEVMF